MKRFLKFGAVLTALILALTCFVACQNDDDDNNDGPKTVAEYISDDYKFEFKDDGNFNVYKKNSMTSNNMIARAAEQDWTLIASGTYEGDPTSKTGTVTMTVKTVAETETSIKAGTYNLENGATITGTGENASITITVEKASENNTPADPDPDPNPDPDPENELVGTKWLFSMVQGDNADEDGYIDITLEFTSATEATYKLDAHPGKDEDDNEIEAVKGALTGTYTVADEKVTFTITAVENTDSEYIVPFMPKKVKGDVFEFTFSEEKAKLSITYKFTKNDKEREVTIDLAKQESQS